MISLRQHAISLAAVFLALAVGVFLGSGVLSDTLLSGLRAEKQDLNKQITTLTDQRNAVNEKLGAANDFDAQMSGRIVRDALAGKSVVLIRTPDADNDDVAAMSRIVGQAGGVVTGTIALTQQFVDANSAEKLRSVVNSSIVPAGAQLSTTMVDQGSQAGDLLGIALLINRKPEIRPADDTQRDTVLAALRDTGFLTYPGDHIGAANTAVIVTGGALGDDAGNQGSTVARFAAAMAPHGAGTVLAGRDGSASGTAAVAVTRADAGMAADVTTVDDISVESGRITTVLALQNLINGGPTGKFGIGPGASSITVPQ
ncbi:copper transporter [Mycolicibacterium helvum]|uniref:Copper transporter MctB n=1 Tax=Mycolicibacterium helvum TaxID=1534349 RepID=A0A7I7TFW9_9MYCO|nr:copper transporter [Mycolicibacterium helvum]BBY67255.1 copper transporter MctB [Mycolicibacterium helvum]